MTSALPPRNAEQITATVLFADVIGFSRVADSESAERAYLAVTDLLRLLDAIARKHAGSVDKYQGDKLMAVFGYPVPLAHPARAASAAALEMRQKVEEYASESGSALPFEIHIGINTGELVGGDISGPVVREFHVLGDAVNVSARLNAKAPVGEIWVGERTYEEARSHFNWKALEPLALKGKSKPVAAYSLVSAKHQASQTDLGFDDRLVAELVGRDAELERLTRALDRLSDRQGGAVLVTGEADSGKSRLLAALGQSQDLDHFQVLQTRGLESLRSRSLGAFEPLFAEGDEGDPLRSSSSPASPEERAASIERLIQQAAESQPLLLVVEDLQWLDPASVDLLDRLVRQASKHRLLLLLTARPGPTATRLADLREGMPDDAFDAFELPPLSRASAEALVAGALGPDDEDPETIEMILGRGQLLPGALLQAAFLAPALRSEREQEAMRDDRTTEAERRRAVVVYADLTGFTAMTEKVGADAAYPVVAACLEILDEAARQYGGTVDHYLGDCVMALFGVPRAIEDAPRAALNAMIEMRERVQTFSRTHELPVDIDVHTGAAMGLGIAGDISGPLIREFAVMGDHVDRADELTHAAEAGEIIVDDATYHAMRDVFEFERAPDSVLPGSPAPQPTWQLVSQAPVLHRSKLGTERRVFSELVGRDEELAKLAAVFAAVAEGQGAIASLSAEAGLGKSRLIAELRRRHSEPLWLEGRSISNGRNLSYHPIADLLRSWAEIGDEDDDDSGREKLDASIRSLLPDQVEEFAPLLARLLRVSLSDEEQARLETIQGDALEKLLRSAILQILRAAADHQPVVVLMEDLHWADFSSLELVESLLSLAEEGGILFLNAFRPGFEDTAGRVQAFVRENLDARHVEIELQPLGPSAARALVKNLFQGGEVPQKTRAAIEERARGNPFYIEEVVRNLVDAGALVFRDGGFHATDKIEAMIIPDSVQDAVLARVDRLDLARRSVLQAASVIGHVFHHDVLGRVMKDAENLDDLIAELEDGEFIESADRSAGVEYAFKHPLIQEVTYDSMLEVRCNELHIDVAKAAETALSESVPGYCAMLAYHYTKGGDLDNAEDYLFRAGDEAARSAASNEALYFFQEASERYAEAHSDQRDPARGALLEKNLAIALLNRGKLMEAVDHFDQTTQLLGAPAPRTPLAMGMSFAADLASVMSRVYLRRRPYGRRASTERDRELVDVMFRRAMAESTSAPTRFLVDSMALIKRFSVVDPYTVPETAAIYAGFISIFSYTGLSFAVGRRFLDLAKRLAEGGAVDERILYFRTLCFLHHLLEGDWSDEHAIEPEVVDEGLRDGRFWEASTYVNLDGVRLLYQGHFDLARERIGKLAEIADLYQHDLAASAQHALTAYLHVERREFEPALAALEIYYDEHAEATFNLLALGTRAKVQCLMGDLEGAQDNLERAEKILSDAGRVAPYHASSVRSAQYLADVLLLERAVVEGQGSVRECQQRAKKGRAVALGTAQKVAFRLPEVLRLTGREAWIANRPAEALTNWNRAHDCCVRLGARPELGRTLAEAGLAMEGGLQGELGGRNAETCLREARSIFETLDLDFDARQLDRAS